MYNVHKYFAEGQEKQIIIKKLKMIKKILSSRTS